MKRGGKHKRRAQKRKSLKNADFYLLKDKQILRDRNQWRDRDFILFTVFFSKTLKKLRENIRKIRKRLWKRGREEMKDDGLCYLYTPFLLLKKKKKKQVRFSNRQRERERDVVNKVIKLLFNVEYTSHVWLIYHIAIASSCS